MYYLSDSRSKAMKNNPHFSVGEISSHLAKEWSKLSSEQRQVSFCYCLSNPE